MGLFDGINAFFGGGAPPAYQTPQHIKDFMQPIPTTELQTVDAYKRLVGNKQDYDYAQMNINGWNERLKNPDLTDEQRQKINEDIQGWTRKRDSAAQAAENTRQSAAAIGIDLSDYGTDKSLAESAQALRTYQNVGANKFLNLPSLGELQDNRYFELRSQGASPRQAERIVGRERGKMQEMLSRKYTDAMTAYGTNPDGSLDQGIGMQLLRGLAKVDPTTATMFYNGFATPGKVFDTNQSRAQAVDLAKINNTEAMARLMENINANWKNAEAQRKTQRTLLDWTLTSREREGQLDREHNERMKIFDAISRLSSGGGNGNKKSAYMQSIEDLATVYEAQGLSKEEALSKAVDAATRHHYSELTNEKLEDLGKNLEVGLKLGLKGDELVDYLKTNAGWKSKADSKAIGAFNTLDEVLGYIMKDDDDAAGELLQSLDTQAEEDLNKFNGQFSEDEHQKYLAMKDAYIEFLNIGKDKSKPADANARAEGKNVLLAKIKAARRGTDWKNELEAIHNANATYRRTHGVEKSTADMDKANENVNKLLNPDNKAASNAQSPPNSSTQVYGGGYPGTWTPMPNPQNNFFGVPYFNK